MELPVRRRKKPGASSAVRWEHFAHVADVGIRGIGATPESAFEQAALALTAVVTEPGSIAPLQRVEISCEAPNLELLLVDWLNAIVYEMATRKMLFSTFHVELEGNRLSGLIGGEAIDVKRHAPAAEVKGATLSELEVVRGGDGRWRAQCIVDV